MYIITTISSPFNPKFLKGRFFFYYHFFINCAKTHCPCYTNFFHYLTYRFAKTRIKQTIWTFFVLQFALLSFFLSSVTIRLKLIIIDESSDDSVTEILQKGHHPVALSSWRSVPFEQYVSRFRLGFHFRCQFTESWKRLLFQVATYILLISISKVSTLNQEPML